MEQRAGIFDILVVGGGHAGLEAAHISAQFGFRVAMVTMPGVSLASTPCNPSIGGVGKGQVVREIDYLGGLMGKITDRAAIHYKTLNASRGYAVRSTRVQIDKERYSKVAEEELGKISNLSIFRARVQKIAKEGQLFQVVTDVQTYRARKVIMTTGTFLAGRLHLGEEQISGGRIGQEASGGMEDIFQNVETLPVRFKTGTPPRLAVDSVCFASLQEQSSDPLTKTFHWENHKAQRFLPQRSCFVTYTNAKTLKIIRDNKDKSPLFNGQIKGVGPRYCPSIEDKAYRYPERDVHHVFLEPEGLDLESIYPSGISSSLPRGVQKSFLHTIPGLEDCEILVYGYAVEYDVVNTAKLSIGLEYREVPGLYFAGQINGTSGYEEAGAQGLVAGINACYNLLGRGVFRLSRDESYVGVLIDDLVGQSRDEPYRLFTARNENRLFAREDNSFLRMAKYRRQFSLSSPLDVRLESLTNEHKLLKSLVFKYVFKEKVHGAYFKSRGWERPWSFSSGGLKFDEFIRSSQSTGDPLAIFRDVLAKSGLTFHPEALEAVAIGEIYRGYIEKGQRELSQQRKLDRAKLRVETLLDSNNISFECKQRVRESMPETFGQLRKIEGIRPATLAYVSSRL